MAEGFTANQRETEGQAPEKDWVVEMLRQEPGRTACHRCDGEVRTGPAHLTVLDHMIVTVTTLLLLLAFMIRYG